MPAPGSDEEKVWGSGNYNNTKYRISYYTVHSMIAFLYDTILFLLHFWVDLAEKIISIIFEYF